jgi:hypothetical protein
MFAQKIAQKPVKCRTKCKEWVRKDRLANILYNLVGRCQNLCLMGIGQKHTVSERSNFGKIFQSD